MKKGFYFIGINDYDHNGEQMFIPSLQEGSYENYGKLFIHRNKDYSNNPQEWKVTHVATGAAIVVRVSLASARLLAKELQNFSLWDIKTYEEIKEAIAESQRNPEGPYYQELKEIREIRNLRA
jgi:hypothetical protein